MSFQKTLIQKKAIDLFISGATKFLLYGGSRSGKSFIILYVQIIMACKYPESRHLIARFRFNSVKRSIWLDTLKKVLKICFPLLKVKWNGEDYFILLPNGSEIWIGGLDDKDRTEKILGMEFMTIFVNEASQISYEAYTTLLTRLAQKCQGIKSDGTLHIGKNLLFVDENPPSKKHWTYKLWFKGVEPESNVALLYDEDYGELRMNPDDNLENIGTDYLKLLESLPERKKKRFRKGEFAEDAEGALWTDDLLNSLRVLDKPTLRRIIVSVDPAVTSKDTSDEVGIVVEGVGHNGHLYVLEDLSDVYSVSEWPKVVVAAFNRWKADRVVAEVNQGGDLVKAAIHQVDKTVPYKGVHATRDKLTRAEPIAALYEDGKAHHVGEFLELELEMTTWESKKGEKSPNRIDALVHGATELILQNPIVQRPKTYM